MELDPELEYLCHMLEDKGATDEEIEAVLAHYGVKGMKWGVRRYQRIQKNLDRVGRIRDGTASKKDRLLAANNSLTFTSKQAGKQLERGAKMQAKVASGKSFMGKMMFKYEKTLLSELDFHQSQN